MNADQRATLDEAMELAKVVLGGKARPWECIEALCQEYLGEHPSDLGEAELLRAPIRMDDPSDELRQWLEEQSNAWEILERVEDVCAPEAPRGTDPFELDLQLRELVALRNTWDETLGRRV